MTDAPLTPPDQRPNLLAWAKRETRQFFLDVRDTIRAFARNRSALLVANLLLLPWFAVIVTGRNTNPLPAFGEIFGIIFLYWFFTRRREAESTPVRRPIIEAALALAFVLIWMLFRIGQFQNFYALPKLPILTTHDLFETIVPKMLEMVIVPLALWSALRYRPRDLGLRLNWRDWIPAGVAMIALIGIGLANNKPQEWVESSIFFYFAAGLPEELLFRSILQTRVIALIKNPVWGLYLAAFIFGASHLPINLSNASANNWLSAFDSAFTFQLSVGFALGYAYYRVRSILPLTFIHTFINAVP